MYVCPSIFLYVPCKKEKASAILTAGIGGAIHFFFEGYFMINHTRMASMTDFFGQLWKEYSLSDSRYMFSDPFVLCMESITAVRPLLFYPSPTAAPLPFPSPFLF